MHTVHPPAMVCRSRTAELCNDLHPRVGSGVPRLSVLARGGVRCHQALLPGQCCMVASGGEGCTPGPGSSLALSSDLLATCLGQLGTRALLHQALCRSHQGIPSMEHLSLAVCYIPGMAQAGQDAPEGSASQKM